MTEMWPEIFGTLVRTDVLNLPSSGFCFYVQWAAAMTRASFPCLILTISGTNPRDFTALRSIAVTITGLLFVSANRLRWAIPSESSSRRICITLSLGTWILYDFLSKCQFLCIWNAVMEFLIPILWLHAKQNHYFYYFSLNCTLASVSLRFFHSMKYHSKFSRDVQ